MSTITTLVTLIGGWVVGVLSSSTALGLYVKHWSRPIISARLQLKRGSYGPVTRIELDGQGKPTGATHEAKYLRVQVENTGLTTIKDCSGHVVRLTKFVGKKKVRGPYENFGRGWSHNPSSEKYDIARGAAHTLDIATLVLRPGGKSTLEFERLPTTCGISFTKTTRGSRLSWSHALLPTTRANGLFQ